MHIVDYLKASKRYVVWGANKHTLTNAEGKSRIKQRRKRRGGGGGGGGGGVERREIEGITVPNERLGFFFI